MFNNICVFIFIISVFSNVIGQTSMPLNFQTTLNGNFKTLKEIQTGEVTWYFKEPRPVGKFANGDYWVLAPVTITAITPDFDGEHNGWQINPVPNGPQSFDIRLLSFNTDGMPSLPYVADSNQSIVKVVSITPYTEKPRPVLKSAIVLTVVGEIPPGNGADVFRPPYVSTKKPMFKVADIKRDSIYIYDSVPNTPSLSSVKNWFEKVQFNHLAGRNTQYSRPSENLPFYGADIAKRTADGALRLMVRGREPEYTNALISYLQCGIDYYYMIENGWIWPRGGGEEPGEKLPITFFVTVLGDDEMKDTVRNRRMYEDYLAFYGKNGVALYGDWGWRSEKTSTTILNDEPYWKVIWKGTGSKTQADPYGYIDGGMEPGGSYQFCCTSQPFKGTVLALLLMPTLRTVWNPRALIDYVDRWVTKGTWTQPDPCAAVGDSADYGIKWGPDPNNKGDCIKDGKGRFPELHGNNVDGGLRKSDFQSAMWDEYRHLATPFSKF